MSAHSFPSKTFLLGEYAVLGGAPALLLAHEPCFRVERSPEGAGFPEGSPAWRLARELGLTGGFTFHDPHPRRGGFGASGAEFLAVARLHPAAPAEPGAFAWFARDLYFAQGGRGSGADILAQASGQAGLLLLRLAERRLEWLPAALGAQATLFHTGRKLATHEHLGSLPPEAMLAHAPEVERAASALRAGDLPAFASALQAYAAGLAASGLVAPHTQEALAALGELPGVLAAKGCGAMGSDVILVLSREPLPALAGWAKAHSLVEAARAAI